MNGINFLQVNDDTVALALTKYLGTFTEAWRNMPMLVDTGLPVIHRTTQTDGKEFQHLQFADVPDAQDFDSGDEMLGQNYGMTEVLIGPDKYLVASAFIKKDQMARSHVSLLDRLARAHARKIRMKRDKRIFITASLAARGSAVFKDGLLVHSGGNRVTISGGTLASALPKSATGAATIRAALRELGYQMDLDSIPAENRYIWVPPYVRNVLLFDNTGQVFNEQYTDADNNVLERKVTLIDGFKLVGLPNFTSNNGSLPDQVISDQPSKYNADFTPGASNGTPIVLALTEGPDGGAAVGEVTFDEIQHIVKWMPERLGWLVASYTLGGVGRLDDYCAGSVELIS